MRENKSPLTVSQALKVYTGTGLPLTVLVLAAYETIFYSASFISMALVIAVSEAVTLTQAVQRISQTPAADCVMAFAPAFINSLLLLNVPHNRERAGGKLLRTVKGGFGTFEKSRAGIYISAVTGTLIYCAFAALLDFIGIAKSQNGIYAAASVLASSTAALGAGTLALMIPGDTARGALSVLVCFAVSVGGAIALNIAAALTGSLTAHIVTILTGAVLVTVSVKIYISYYRKNLWNN